MRQLSPHSNLMLACLAAVGLVSSLGLPWYATAETADGLGPMEAIGARLLRTFTSEGVITTGTDTLGGSRTLLLVIAAAVIVLSAAMAVPALRAVFRDVLRAVGFGAPVLVLATAVRSSAGLELRWGLVVSVAIALVMASAAWHGAAARPRREPAAPRTRAAA
jgi:hypothetical protein